MSRKSKGIRKKRSSSFEEHVRPHLNAIRSRNPKCTSAVGALLAEIREGTDLGEKRRAAWIYGLFGYQRGLPQLEAALRKVEAKVNEEKIGSPESYCMSELCFGLGNADTSQSHEILLRAFQRTNNPWSRSLVLDGMAFEKIYFNWDLVRSFLRIDAHRYEVLSALYAVALRQAQTCPEEVRKRIGPLLKSEHREVRQYSLWVLSFNSMNRDLIETLKDDLEVAKEYAEAIRMVDHWEK